MNKAGRGIALCLAGCLLAGLTACDTSGAEAAKPEPLTQTYEKRDDYLENPLMGFAPEADYKAAAQRYSLVYLEILWKDWEPEEGRYAVDAVREENHLDRWREEGKHVVLRFVCDKPSGEAHRDIPQWLYDKTGGDGTDYAYSSKKGYSPNYDNKIFIEAHQKAIAALGQHFGADTFVSYVELGSLGHWGEWHVNYESGIQRLPAADVREQYVTPYIGAFPHAKLLMRRPFNTAAQHGFGLYNDMAGHPASTSEWLDWIQHGGDYNQALEKNALSPMPDAWKTAPIGGEFNSDLTMDEMLGTSLSQTVSLLRDSHTTFLGPKVPHGLSESGGKAYPDGIQAVLNALGYRLRIERSSYTAPTPKTAGEMVLSWTNDGAAPFYEQWPVYLYFLDSQNKVLQAVPVNVDLRKILPGKPLTSSTRIDWTDAVGEASFLCVGIEDPMTGKAAVSLAMKADEVENMTVLYTFTQAVGSDVHEK